MSHKQQTQLIKEKTLRAVYLQKQIQDQIKGLPYVLENNGAGSSGLGEMLGDTIAKNNALMLLNREITQAKLDLEGLFSTSNPLGADVHPVRVQ